MLGGVLQQGFFPVLFPVCLGLVQINSYDPVSHSNTDIEKSIAFTLPPFQGHGGISGSYLFPIHYGGFFALNFQLEYR